MNESLSGLWDRSGGIATRYGLEGTWIEFRRSQWPSGLRRGSAADRLQGLRVRIQPGACCTVKDKRQSQDNQDREVQMKYREQKRISVGRDFPHPSRPLMMVHPASCIMGTG